MQCLWITWLKADNLCQVPNSRSYCNETPPMTVQNLDFFNPLHPWKQKNSFSRKHLSCNTPAKLYTTLCDKHALINKCMHRFHIAYTWQSLLVNNFTDFPDVWVKKKEDFVQSLLALIAIPPTVKRGLDFIQGTEGNCHGAQCFCLPACLLQSSAYYFPYLWYIVA